MMSQEKNMEKTWKKHVRKFIKFAYYKKRAIRNVTKSAYTAHTEPLHKEYNILIVQDLYQLAILKFYCKLVNNNLPQY